ncbi:hypothetical protein FB45DRAFT_906327 [Roridomyces roridus]|uniref:Uncharacterized protein n=1 Tax=Roridomyces roridus TaxID=1738132 RepID=A0AAD7C0X5_9AGAR|nr:hypothetical protein FB45DRAFT_906327 [Roridomyces roridus]
MSTTLALALALSITPSYAFDEFNNNHHRSTTSRIVGAVIAIVILLLLLYLFLAARRRRMRTGSYYSSGGGILAAKPPSGNFGGGYAPWSSAPNPNQGSYANYQQGYGNQGSEYPPTKGTEPVPPPYTSQQQYAPPPGPPPQAHVNDKNDGRDDNFVGGFRR